mgnify:CR=1 FL=1|jgi:glycosyltransferase involved in cell wall biosynthesis
MIPKVTIIIPVYNTEKHLQQCLTSAISQTLKSIEIIVINDASTDNSLEIIKEFEKKDSRIQLINFKKNKGNGVGRNTALKQAKGKYVLFLDADDWLEKDASKLLYKKASSENLEIVLFGYTRHLYVSKKSFIILPDYQENDSNINHYFLTHTKGFGSMPWIYLYSRNLLINNNITFTEGVYFEDVNFVAQAIFNVKKIGVVKRPLYNYLIHADSITGFLTKQKIDDLFTVHIILKNYLIKKGVFKKYEKEYLVRFLIFCIEYSFLGYFKMQKNYRDKELDEFMDEMRKSDVMHLNSIAVLKEVAAEYKDEKRSYKQMMTAYHFLVTIRKYYCSYRFVYKTQYLIYKFFKKKN